MNKGQTIRKYIEEGLSNEAILANVNTTLNSIRWHRSKMQAGPTLRVTTTASVALTPGSVGAALERFGFADEVRECIKRLEVADPEALYKRLADWAFTTNSKPTGRWGQCSYGRRKIEIHGQLLKFAADLRQTFLHECAHALDFMINGRSSGHGAQWKHVMSWGFGLNPIRCGGHSEEATAALTEIRKSKAIATWECSRCKTEFPILKKRKHAPETYTHRKCGGHLQVKE